MSNNSTLDRLQQLLPELFQPVQVAGTPYLRFYLTAEIPVLLPMERVQEALLVPASAVSPLPNLPDFAIGMMSARDRVFLVMDLGQLLGFPALPINPRNHQILVLHLPALGTENHGSSTLLSEKLLGLAVYGVRGVTRFESEHLQPFDPETPVILHPYLLGSFMEENKRISVLNAESVMTSPLLTTNSVIQSKYSG